LKEAGVPAGHAARKRALAALFRAVVAATAVSAALIACGGGGGGASAPESPPPAPTPKPAPAPSPSPTGPIAAQMTVPTPVGYDADRLAAFNRLNEIRLSAGLGMLAQSTAMDQAAQAHAEWMVANDSFTHEETAGTAGFTGESWPRRDEALGYVPVGGGEVMSEPVHGAAGVDSLINTVYHRAIMLAFEPVDVGIGWSAGAASSVSMPLVLDLTKPSNDATRGYGQAAQSWTHGAAVWPIDGARDVPLRLGLESPNPAPGHTVSTLGTPISITVDDSRAISANQFVLVDGMTGAAVPTQMLTNQNDSNFLVPESFIALIPLSALSPNTTYQVTFSGSTVQFPSGVVEAFVRSWSFATGTK
jgi:uncharacterized protein YkwD